MPDDVRKYAIKTAANYCVPPARICEGINRYNRAEALPFNISCPFGTWLRVIGTGFSQPPHTHFPLINMPKNEGGPDAALDTSHLLSEKNYLKKGLH